MIYHVKSLCATCYEMPEQALTWRTLMAPKEPLSSIVSIFCVLKKSSKPGLCISDSNDGSIYYVNNVV